jgi:hypothetical protein
MSPRHDHWLSAQVAAALLGSTSGEVCRLISLGRLSAIKRKQPGRPGKAQWLINPKSIAEEKRRSSQRTAVARRAKRPRARR